MRQLTLITIFNNNNNDNNNNNNNSSNNDNEKDDYNNSSLFKRYNLQLKETNIVYLKEVFKYALTLYSNARCILLVRPYSK